MKTRFASSFLFAIVASALLSASTALALPLALTGRGSGNEVGVAGSCNGSGNSCTGSGTSCECYQFTGTGNATAGVGNVNVSTNFLLNLGTLVDNLACESATGVLKLAQKNKPANVLALDYQGVICLAVTQAVFNGSFAVDGDASLGKFANALGSGTFTASIAGDSTLTLGNINGTLQLP